MQHLHPDDRYEHRFWKGPRGKGAELYSTLASSSYHSTFGYNCLIQFGDLFQKSRTKLLGWMFSCTVTGYSLVCTPTQAGAIIPSSDLGDNY